MAYTIEEMICEIPNEADSIPELENIIDRCWVKISNIRGEKFCLECGQLVESALVDVPPHTCPRL